MKKLFYNTLFTLLCLLMTSYTRAQFYSQQITAAEYFWGSVDPGVGNGIAIAAKDGNYNNAIESALASGTTAPNTGLNLLNVRFKGNNGTWGGLYKAVMNVDASFSSASQITQAEYFIDTDNGAGNNLAMIAFDGNYNNAIESAIKSGINAPSIGLHTIGVRMLGIDGTWGAAFLAIINIDTVFTADIKITAAEYYFDTDPGAGNATPMLALDANFDSAIETAIASAASSSLSPGNHILAVRMKGFDGTWGSAYQVVLVVDPCTPIPTASITAASTTNFCSGGSVVLNANTGSGLTYQWRKDGLNISLATSASYTASQTGVYDVAITNSSGCSAISNSITVTVTPTAVPVVTIAASPGTTVCPNTAITFTATPVNGGANPVYEWQVNGNVVGGNSATYVSSSLTTNDLVTCKLTSSEVCASPQTDNSNTLVIIVYALPSSTVTANGPTTFCQGGSVTLTASAGNTYLWSNNATSQSIIVTSSGSYSVTVTNGNNCSVVSTPISVTVNTNPSAAISPATVTICNGASATLTASGGTSYTWSNSLGSNTTVNVSPTTTTTYTVTVTDANNCSAIASRLVTVNANPTAAISPATVTICNGASATLTASGGTSYAWSNSLGSNASVSVSPTTTTTYTVTVTNANNCSATASRLVTVNANPTAAISPASVAICSGTSASLTASGGTSYTWSNSLGSNSIVNVSPTTTTTYSVTITDANNCSAIASRLVTVNANPIVAISPATVNICNGSSASLTASGGTSYAWSNSLGSNATVNVSPTTTTNYSVTVTDANNCSAIASRLVTVNTNPSASISPATLTICSGASATLTASGGTSYTWSNSLGSNATVSVSPTTTTTYTVTVTNANNCSATASRLVTVNANPTAAISPATVTICSGASASLTANGGASYTWSNSLGSNSTVNVSPTTTTTYSVTITDANNCSAIASRLVTVNANPIVAISPATVNICNGSSASLTASGGTSYAWSNSLGSNTTVNVSPTTTTTYSVTVTDANNCSAIASRLVTVNANPTAAISPATVTICNGASATLTASGGTSYAWSNSLGSNATVSVSPTTTTTYTVTVTNANNCSATASRLVTVNTNPTAAISPATVTICSGASALLTASGGTSYTWSNSLGSNAIVNVSPTTTTTYSVTVTDANLCSATTSKLVTVNQLPNATINGPTNICSGLSATLTAGGGTGYSWNNSLGTNAQVTVTPLSTTTYTVTVTDGNNCSASTSQTVSVNTQPTASISGTSQICIGQTITLTANGGNTYLWANNLGTNASITVSPTTTTTYSVTATIGANCSATSSKTIIVNQPAATQFSQTICSGTGYLFIGINRTISGNYLDTLQTLNGCDSIVTLNLTVNAPLTGSFNQTICSGTGYLFNGINRTISGNYLDTLQTLNGCDSIVTINLTVNAPLTGSFNQTICSGTGYLFNGINRTVSGNYLDTLQTLNGCDSIVTLNLSVNTLLQSTYSDSICSGDTYLFNGVLISQTGQFNDTVQSLNGCDSIITLSLFVNALPTPSIINNSNTLNTDLFTTYQWLKDNAVINGAMSQSLVFTETGNYSVIVTDENGCSDTSEVFNALFVNLINDFINSNIKVYPNPNYGEFTIEFNDHAIKEIEITDALGKVIAPRFVLETKKHIVLDQIAAGMYFLNIKQDGLLRSLKINVLK